MSTELLASGLDDLRAPRSQLLGRWSRRHRRGLVVAAVISLLLVTADQWQQQRELDALLMAVTAGEEEIEAAQAPISGTVNYYSPVLVSSASTPNLRGSFAADLAEVSLDGAVVMEATSTGVSRVRVLPWHTGLLDARQTYVDRIDLWASYFESLAEDPDELFASHDQLAESAAAAARALADAVPWSGNAADVARVQDALPEK